MDSWERAGRVATAQNRCGVRSPGSAEEQRDPARVETERACRSGG